MIDESEKNFNVVLVHPEIPQNTGNIGRTCVGMNCHLHLIGPLGFEINDKHLKRAGLDYWPLLKWTYYPTFSDWAKVLGPNQNIYFLTTKSKKPIYNIQFQQNDWLVFGRETKGLEPEVLNQNPENCFQIPMPGPVRSLNLATSVAVVLYEGIRQLSTN